MIKHGVFDITGTGTKNVTGVGFRPGAVIIFWRVDPSTTNSGGGFGATDGTSQFAAVMNTNNTNYGRNANTSNCIIVNSATNSTVTAAQYSSFNSDGFTLNVSTAASTQGFSYIAFHEDLDVSVGSFSVAATGTLNITSAGFRPNGGLFFWLPASSASAAAFGVGGVDRLGAANQFATFGNSDSSNRATDSSTSHCIRAIAASSTVVTSASFSSFLSNGFQLSVATASSTQSFGYVAFGPNMLADLGSLNIPTSATTFSVSGVAFQPHAVVSIRRRDTDSTRLEAGIGFADNSISQSSVGWGNDSSEAARTSNISYAFTRRSAASIIIEAAITAFNSDGFSGTVNTSVAGTNFSFMALAHSVAGTSPVSTGLHVNDVTPTFHETAATSPLNVTLTIQDVTPTYINVTTEIVFSSFTINSVTPLFTIAAEISTPVSIDLTVLNVAATHKSTANIENQPEILFSIPIVHAVNVGIASLDEVGLVMEALSPTPTYKQEGDEADADDILIQTIEDNLSIRGTQEFLTVRTVEDSLVVRSYEDTLRIT